MAKINTEVKKIIPNIGMESNRKKAKSIVDSINEIGTKNSKSYVGGENLLKRHGKEKFQINL